MKLRLESDHILAYGATVEVDGVQFEVVTLLKQAFYNRMYWIYEVRVRKT